MHADTSRPRNVVTGASRFDGPPGLSGDLWPIHPRRQDDELLSSWIVRTAHANRIKLQTFTTLALGETASLWNRDIDRCASDALLLRLSTQTGSDVETLRQGLLSTLDGAVFERHTPLGNTKWILPLGIYHRTRHRFGVQFCPLCLFFDEKPYYRRTWRLAFATICDRHGCLLHDRCPHCEAPVAHFRNDLGRRRDYRIGDHVSCWNCGFDLRRAPASAPDGPDGQTLMALRSLVAFHRLGWWFQRDASLAYGHLYFDALHHLVHFLPTAHGRRLLDVIAREASRHFPDHDTQSRERFELRPLKSRHALLVAALWLLGDWPDRFLTAARDAGVPQSRILRGERRPFWFESEIRWNLGDGFHTPTAAEAKHAADYLARKGSAVSAVTVGQLIGSKDANAAKAYAASRGPLEDDEFQRMIAVLNEEIRREPPGRKRLLLQRDRTILRLLYATRWKVSKVLGLTVAEGLRLASTPKAKRTYPGCVAGLILTYLRDTRRHLAPEDDRGKLFVGNGSAGIGVTAWEWRKARLREGARRA